MKIRSKIRSFSSLMIATVAGTLLCGQAEAQVTAEQGYPSQITLKWDENEQEFTNIRYVAEALLEKKQIKLYELIGISDGLLSDYSSVAVDYLLLDRPLGYVLADYNIYKEKRGFVFEDPLEYMPGEKIYNACDIRKFMKHLTDGTDSYRQERAKNLKQMHNKTENYCKRLADYLQL